MASHLVRSGVRWIDSWLQGPEPVSVEVEKFRQESVSEIAPNVYCFRANGFMFEQLLPWFLKEHPELEVDAMTDDGAYGGSGRFFVSFREKKTS